MITGEFLDQLSRFSLIIHKRVTSNYAGPRRSITQGRGIMFKDHRVYAPGDDFRSIDWKVFARTDDLYIKNFEEDRNLVVHIIIDNSASMNYKSSNMTKFDYASMIGLGFSYLTVRENGKFQFATFAQDMTVFSPKKGRSQIMVILDYLNNLKPGKETDFKESMNKYKRYIKNRSLIIIVSDCLYDVEQIETSLYRLGGKGHNIKLIQVLDPNEIDLSELSGDTNLEDLESGFKLRTYISNKLKNDYRNKLKEHNGKVHDVCNKLGVEFFTVSTGDSIFDSFYKVVR